MPVLFGFVFVDLIELLIYVNHDRLQWYLDSSFCFCFQSFQFSELLIMKKQSIVCINVRWSRLCYFNFELNFKFILVLFTEEIPENAVGVIYLGDFF